LAARQAFKNWSSLSFDLRQSYIEKFVEGLKQNQLALAQAIHDETGKPLWESKTEIASMIGKAGLSIDAYQKRTGTMRSKGNAVGTRLSHRAIGVFAVLGPYNFPGHLPNGHIIPALLAGNTVVFKPSEHTPMFAELMMHCWIETGLPDGVLNLIQGGRETGELLAANSEIDGLLFTGSSKTGAALHKVFAGKPEKMLALEMGGNNPLVLEHCKNIDAAVYMIIQSAFISSGQRCTCARRLILIRSEKNNEIVEKLISSTASLKVGMDDDCFMGPLISNLAADNVMATQQGLLVMGAVALHLLERPDPERPFVYPGILDVTAIDQGDDEECFGPLLQLIWVNDMEQAIIEANKTRFGLSAGLLSDSEQAWALFYKKTHAGIVNWNRPLTGASGAAPFGGVGASGNFRPGAFYAADYCAYPVASLISTGPELPEQLTPGISL